MAFFVIFPVVLYAENLFYKGLVNIKEVSSLGFKKGHVAFCTSKNNIFLLDFRDFDHVISSRYRLHPTPPGRIYDIALKGDTLYLALGEWGVYLFKIDPPRFLHKINVPGKAIDVEVQGNRIYVADAKKGLLVYSLSPGNFIEIAKFPSSGRLSSISLRDSFIFLSEREEGVEILKILNDTVLKISHIKSDGESWRVTFKDKLAFLADGTGGLKIFYIGNPYKPKEIGRLRIRGSLRDLLSTENRLYLASLSQGIVEVDIKKPRHPKVIGVIKGPEMPIRLYRSDSIVAVLDQRKGVYFYSLRDR